MRLFIKYETHEEHSNGTNVNKIRNTLLVPHLHKFDCPICILMEEIWWEFPIRRATFSIPWWIPCYNSQLCSVQIFNLGFEVTPYWAWKLEENYNSVHNMNLWSLWNETLWQLSENVKIVLTMVLKSYGQCFLAKSILSLELMEKWYFQILYSTPLTISGK